MKKTTLSIFFLLYCINVFSQSVRDIKSNDWTIHLNPTTKKLTYSFKGKKIIEEAYAKVKVNTDTLYSSDYADVKLTSANISDGFGKGKRFELIYSDKAKPTLKQYFYFYSKRDYFSTETVVESKGKISSNYLAPICSDNTNTFLQKSASNRGLRVPFDNDAFVPYLSKPLNEAITSFEVSAIFNGENRNGIVIGSIEHDTWKTGIKYKGINDQSIHKLEVYGGITDELTRDISDKEDRPSAEHGSISGHRLKSPKIFLGYFADWRKGLEEYGKANAIISPPMKWDEGTPFGWNSWAAMAAKVNYEGAINVSDFIKKELQTNNFSNDGTTYIVLDSFWDNFSDEQLLQFVAHCNSNGQKAGIYWCPFSDWIGNTEAFVEGTSNQYHYKDAYLYSQGKPRKIESLAMDPTHPATKQRIDYFIGKFKKLGFKYVKIDFINNGTLEADSFFNTSVTTGIQAYNEGMKYLQEACGDQLLMALSIAPTFPSQYAVTKRISCDAWGSINEDDWGSTGYMLNSLSFGWWLDRVYPFNDADHILLHKDGQPLNYQEGSNRARVTSAVITGVYIIGDNLSEKGSFVGDPIARERTKSFTSNSEINDIARIGKSFYPVEGYTAPQPNKTERVFMYETDKEVYVAIFNFNKEEEIGNIELKRLNLNSNQIKQVKELWFGNEVTIKEGKLPYTIPGQDVRVFKLAKKI
nr:hypothetical protein [Pedobacter panaciterrae]